MRHNVTLKKIYLILIGLSFLSIIFFMSAWLVRYYPHIAGNMHLPNIQKAILNILSERTGQMVAMIISALLISSTSLTFQTLTHNRILTPASLGFDAIFAVTQTLLVAGLGFVHVFLTNVYFNFILSSLIMLGIILLMYQMVLRKNKNNIIFLLLVGIVISSMALSLSNVIQSMLSDDAFYQLQSLTTVTITNINRELVYLLMPFVILIAFLIYRGHRTYDVMALGESQASNLGVNYQQESKRALIYIALAIAMTTALVGPLSFLGLLAVNLAREITKRYEHKHLFITSALISIIFLFFGQVVIELTHYQTTLTTVINLVGGIYMINLLIRKDKTI
ncbi:MAG: iron chelate uptake ABC transporter family permease subunit [Bacilli bacterium]